MGSCNRGKKRICAEEGESISIVKEGKRKCARVY